MKLINIKDVSDNFLRQNYTINNVSFLDKDSCYFIYDSCNGDISVIKDWFNKIKIKHDSISFIGKFVVYTVDGEQLMLADLSAGERYLLYLLSCKYVNKCVIAKSLFERLGGTLEDFVYEEFKDYDNLTIIIYNFIVKPQFRYLYGGVNHE